jgi:hypothetical protein
MGLSGIFLKDSLTSGIARAEVVFRKALEDDVLNTATEALDYAKEQAPWEDRTGDAREGLDTDVRWEGETIVWELYHTVDYGLYLETIQNGKFAIIMPTLEMYASHVGMSLSESMGGDDG